MWQPAWKSVFAVAKFCAANLPSQLCWLCLLNYQNIKPKIFPCILQTIQRRNAHVTISFLVSSNLNCAVNEVFEHAVPFSWRQVHSTAISGSAQSASAVSQPFVLLLRCSQVNVLAVLLPSASQREVNR